MPSSSSRRHVSFPKVFAKVVGIVPELESEIGLENMDKIFWGDDGIRKIRQSASKTSDELRDAEPTLVKSLDKTYQRAKELVARGSSSSGQEEEEEELIASHAQNFQPWVDGARGLERFVSNHHDSERAEVIDEVRDIVVTMSLRGDDAEKIALAYKKHSKVSCAFARITGQADELVVIKGDTTIDVVVLEEDALRKTRTSSHLDGDRRSRSPKPTGAGRGTSRSRSRSPKSMMSLMNGSSHHNNNNKKPRRPFLQRSISSSRMLPKSSKEFVKEEGGEENGEEKTQQQTVEKEQSRGRSWFGRSSRSGAKQVSASNAQQRQNLGGSSSSQSPPPRNDHNGLVVVVPKASFRHSHEELLSTTGPPKREEKKQPRRKARSISPAAVRPSTNKSDQPRRRRRPQSSQPELDVERLCI